MKTENGFEVDTSTLDQMAVEVASLFVVSPIVEPGKAILVGANPTGAILTGATLRGADLNRCDLTHADLSGADLCQTKLDEAVLTSRGIKA